MLQLPEDLLAYLGDFLSNKDRKVLRLADRRLNASFPLRMNRVFLSTSYKNIEVFRAVAAHPMRKQVKEIIWDDARFEKFDPKPDGDDLMPFERVRNIEDFESAREENLGWLASGDGEAFVRARKGGIDWETLEPLDTDPVLPGEYLSLEESFHLYDRLYNEQEAIIRDGLDIGAFKEGLAAFTELERVTVTNEAYRPHIITPLYPTPLIRSFPLGFNYPAPWPWMHYGSAEIDGKIGTDGIRKHWHGIAAAIDGLAQFDERRVPELVIDTRYEQMGMPYAFFDIPSPELRSFETLCQRLRRLDLAVNTFPMFQNPGLRQLPHGRLRGILAKATSLESFSLHTSSDDEVYEIGSGMLQVLSAVPMESWPSLRHITLSSIPVVFEDLIQFFERLPNRLKSIQLVDVRFPKGNTFKSLLEICRNELHWSAGQPKLTIGRRREEGPFLTRRLWIEEEIADFFDGKGHNPFAGGNSENSIQLGYGTIRDDLDPDLEIPHVPNP